MTKLKRILRDAFVTLATLAAVFALVLVMQRFFKVDRLIPMLFVLGVFVVSRSTEGYLWGIAASLLGVLLVNYAFMFPYYAIDLLSPVNMATAVVMLIVSVMTSTLTTQISVQQAEKAAAEREKLRANLKKRNIENVEVVEQDFLDYKLPTTPYRVFSNPPFHLSSKIVHKLIEANNPPESFYLILQKQFALKLLNTDRHYTSQLGLQLIQSYQTKIRLPLKPTDFTPPPAVPTVFFEAKRIKQD